jgi:hypothetical protein
MYGLDLEDVRIATPGDVRPAAERLRDIVHDMLGFRVAICHNIALSHPMVDANGEVLATSVFGWTNDENDAAPGARVSAADRMPLRERAILVQCGRFSYNDAKLHAGRAGFQ